MILLKKDKLTLYHSASQFEYLETNGLKEAGLGTVSEIFNGNSPQSPQGCIAQAWSAVELLRVIHTYSLSVTNAEGKNQRGSVIRKSDN